jgi:hypothetical protein
MLQWCTHKYFVPAVLCLPGLKEYLKGKRSTQRIADDYFTRQGFEYELED